MPKYTCTMMNILANLHLYYDAFLAFIHHCFKWFIFVLHNFFTFFM